MQRMRDVLRDQLGRGLRELSPEDRLVAAWQVVCGAALAAHGEVGELDAEGWLEVRVASAEWMAEFEGRRVSLRNDLARVAGVALSGIHFREAGNLANRRRI